MFFWKKATVLRFLYVNYRLHIAENLINNITSSYNYNRIKIRTTSLAGGLLTPYKGLLPAKPKGLLKKILLLHNQLRNPSGYLLVNFFLCWLTLKSFLCYNFYAHNELYSFIQNVADEPIFL